MVRTEREVLEREREILPFQVICHSLVNEDEEENSPGGLVVL